MDATPTVLEHRFRAMGSEVHLLVVDGAPRHLAAAIDRIEQLEGRWSRFRASSEVCRLNDHAGDALAVSDDTVLLVTRAIAAWHLSGGSFDPTLLDALRRAGYDRTFDAVRVDPRGDAVLAPLAFDRPGVTDIEVDGRHVRLPSGTSFDPGGIGKGLAADLVAALVLDEGAAGVLVNMGGDVRVAGRGPTGGAWTVGIEHPAATSPIALVGLWSGAVATSTVLKRAWYVGGVARHHLIDPHTGAPSDSDVALASVVGGTAWEAEVLAKAALLRGVDRAFDLLGPDMAGLVVDHDGRITISPTFTTFTGGATPRSWCTSPDGRAARPGEEPA